MQMSTNDHQRSTINFNGNELAFVRIMISIISGNSLYSENYAHTSVLPADFRSNTVRYRQVGRSVLILSQLTVAIVGWLVA